MHISAPFTRRADEATVEDSDLFESGTRVAIYGGGQLGITEDGLQQEYVSVKNSQVFELPDTISLDEGAALPINYVTAYQALTRVGRIESGQTILISGAAGAVGHALIQLSRALGARPVAVVSSPLKAEAARKSGAAAVVDLSTEILSDVVSSLTAGQGAAVRPVIDSAWTLKEFEQAYKRLASRQAMGAILLKA